MMIRLKKRNIKRIRFPELCEALVGLIQEHGGDSPIWTEYLSVQSSMDYYFWNIDAVVIDSNCIFSQYYFDDNGIPAVHQCYVAHNVVSRKNQSMFVINIHTQGIETFPEALAFSKRYKACQGFLGAYQVIHKEAYGVDVVSR